MVTPTTLPGGAPGLTRRSFLSGAASLAALSSTRLLSAATPEPKFSANPFTLGVASGDPAADSIVLWTRLAPDPQAPAGGMPAQAIEVQWLIAEDEGLGRIVHRGTERAEPQWGHSVHVEVGGLRPDRWYWYQFTAGGASSAKGRTRTLPAAGVMPARLRFAVANCQHYETGYYTAYEHLAAEDLDLVVHLGDYIYEGAAQDRRPRRHNSGEIFTLDDYRRRYALYKSDPALQAAHQAAPWITTWDDHEVANNYAADIPEKPATRDAFLRRRAFAYQAYYEHLPLRRAARPTGPDLPLYRRLSYGRLAQFHVLDTRQYRTDQPCGDGNKPPCPDALNPTATLLGAAQREWLLAGLERSPATWNILAQQVMMARVDRAAGPAITHSMDQWPGYEFERRRILRHFAEGRARNPVVLTGDIHTNWANELIADFDELGGRSVGVEFVATSISSGGDGREAPDTLDQLLAENPFVKFHNTERGYLRCEVTPREWRTDYRTVPFVSRPGAPLQTRATFVVQAGTSTLQRSGARSG